MAIKNESKFQDIIEYYDKTRLDYKVSWDNSPTPAVHFGFYDEKSDKHATALMNTNRVLAELAEIQEGEKVLDAGCGKGGSSFWLAINKNVEAVGITPVQSQIEDCLKQAEILKLKDQTSFVRADYCNTTFKDESFDVVWACESLCHADYKLAFYKEAYRLLRPGGRLVIAEYIRNQRPMKDEEEELLMSWLNGWAIKDIDTREEHKRHSDKAGFSKFELRDVTKNMKVSLRNLHRNSTKWYRLSNILKVFGLRSKVQQRNMFASIKQYEALEKDLWFYSFILCRK